MAGRRAVVLVLDSAGVGELPDAARYRDEGSSTVPHVAATVAGLRLPNLEALGLGRIVPIAGGTPLPHPEGAFGRMTEQSAGKDSTTGHWELMGLILPRPFPTYPHGFPPEIIRAFEQAIGRPVLGNRPASGTVIIDELGEEHRRTARRRAFSLEPRGRPVLDALTERGIPVYAIGKIGDLFAERGITESVHTHNDLDGLARTAEAARRGDRGLIFTNVVDLDTVYGHRNDVEGYARQLERIDAALGPILDAVGDETLLIITADHGNDPTTPSTDHSREYVPLLVHGPGIRRGTDLGTRQTFADAGVSVAAAPGAPWRRPGRAVVLGSGLGALADAVERDATIPYREIPHFPVSTAAGHAGNLVLGMLEGKPVVVMQGRGGVYHGGGPGPGG